MSNEPRIMDIIRARHSVRSYRDESIDGGTMAALLMVVDECVRQSGLDIQIVPDNP